MNRKFFLFAVVAMILVAIAACSKDELGVEVIVPQQERMDSYRVSVDEALCSAETILRAGDRDTRSAVRRVKSTELYVAKPATRSNENTEVSFYLINYEDNAGYALVSTDERTTPVYMYAEEGNITTEDLQKDGPMQMIMDENISNYEYEVAGFQQPEDIIVPDTLDYGRPIFIDGNLCYVNTDTIYVEKGPFCSTRWIQRDPYNEYCENGYVGCGPLAAGQIMAYYQYPPSYGQYTYNWEDITSIPRAYELRETGVENTARLLREIGRIATAQYNPASTSTSTQNIKRALGEFGYNCGPEEIFYWNVITNEIDNGRPVYARGDNNDNQVGHAWVIDGYVRHYCSKKYYYASYPYELYKQETMHNHLYLKYNFGYGSNFNQLTTDYDVEYNYNKKILRNIQPNTNNNN